MKKQNITNFLLAAFLTFYAQDSLASASASAAAPTLDDQDTGPVTAGRPGQTVKVSLVYDVAKGPKPLIQDLDEIILKLPKGEEKTIKTYLETDGRLSVDDAFDVSGLTSFPVSLTFMSDNWSVDEQKILPWKNYENMTCKNDSELDMPRVKEITILWDFDGNFHLKYEFNPTLSTIKSAAKN